MLLLPVPWKQTLVSYSHFNPLVLKLFQHHNEQVALTHSCKFFSSSLEIQKTRKGFFYRLVWIVSTGYTYHDRGLSRHLSQKLMVTKKKALHRVFCLVWEKVSSRFRALSWFSCSSIVFVENVLGEDCKPWFIVNSSRKNRFFNLTILKFHHLTSYRLIHMIFPYSSERTHQRFIINTASTVLSFSAPLETILGNFCSVTVFSWLPYKGKIQIESKVFFRKTFDSIGLSFSMSFIQSNIDVRHFNTSSPSTSLLEPNNLKNQRYRRTSNDANQHDHEISDMYPANCNDVIFWCFDCRGYSSHSSHILHTSNSSHSQVGC